MKQEDLISRAVTVLFALPHIHLILKNGEIPRLNYILLVVMCLYIIFGYTRMVEVCGGPKINRSISAGLLPLAMTFAVTTLSMLYVVNDHKLTHYVGTPVGSNLGSSLGQVRQYRLDDVIDRFRTIVTNRHDEIQESVHV